MSVDIKLNIAGLVYNQTVMGTYGLVLAEETGTRRFSVLIGEPEAQSIALKMNNKKSPRPLTHDLIKTLLNVLDAKLEKVLIYDMVNDIFYSELHIRYNENAIIVDARTSDAVAVAVRADCPIYIKSEILDMVGSQVGTENNEVDKDEEENVTIEQLTSEDLSKMSLETLENLLEMCLKEEKYEAAVSLRDVIKSKKGS
jgi:uncharacterized protein